MDGVVYCTVLYCTVLYCTVLYCTVLYCTVLYRDRAGGAAVQPTLGAVAMAARARTFVCQIILAGRCFGGMVIIRMHISSN